MTAKCARCGQKARVELKYCGEWLCESCFTRLFEDRVKKTIRTNRLLREDDRIGVALSGGKDSAVALFFLYKLASRLPKAEVVALSIDQGISGYGDTSLKAAKKLCKELKIRHHVYSFRKEYGFGLDGILKKAEKKGFAAPPCSICGVLRRKLLNNKARELGLTKIATGHNMDDEVESSLMNYIRGDYGRLSRMGAKVGTVRDESFVQRIKPLRNSPENEIRLYADINRLTYEKKRCPYSKEAFRRSIRKALDEIETNHPGSKFQLLRSTDRLIEVLRDLPQEEMKRCASCSEPSSGERCKFCVMCEELGL